MCAPLAAAACLRRTSPTPCSSSRARPSESSSRPLPRRCARGSSLAFVSMPACSTEPPSQLGVIQFSAHARTEVELAVVDDVEAFASALRAIEPLGSNTSLTAALREAEDALSTASVAGCRRIVVLLSDGRLDSYQSAQAALLCARLSRAGTVSRFFALGLGECVDEAELCRVISGADKTSSISSGDKSNEEKGDTGAPHTAAPRCPFFWSLNARAEVSPRRWSCSEDGTGKHRTSHQNSSHSISPVCALLAATAVCSGRTPNACYPPIALRKSACRACASPQRSCFRAPLRLRAGQRRCWLLARVWRGCFAG